MLITIENHDERVTIDTATPYRATATALPGAAGAPSGPAAGVSGDLDAGPAGFDPAGNRSAAATASGLPLAVVGADPIGGGVLDGGAYSA